LIKEECFNKREKERNVFKRAGGASLDFYLVRYAPPARKKKWLSGTLDGRTLMVSSWISSVLSALLLCEFSGGCWTGEYHSC
jgi:hypothetical protein